MQNIFVENNVSCRTIFVLRVERSKKWKKFWTTQSETGAITDNIYARKKFFFFFKKKKLIFYLITTNGMVKIFIRCESAINQIIIYDIIKV